MGEHGADSLAARTLAGTLPEEELAKAIKNLHKMKKKQTAWAHKAAREDRDFGGIVIAAEKSAGMAGSPRAESAAETAAESRARSSLAPGHMTPFLGPNGALDQTGVVTTHHKHA